MEVQADRQALVSFDCLARLASFAPEVRYPQSTEYGQSSSSRGVRCGVSDSSQVESTGLEAAQYLPRYNLPPSPPRVVFKRGARFMLVPSYIHHLVIIASTFAFSLRETGQVRRHGSTRLSIIQGVYCMYTWQVVLAVKQSYHY